KKTINKITAVITDTTTITSINVVPCGVSIIKLLRCLQYMTNQPNEQPGFLLIDKPAGITSHDVINTLRRITGIKKIGHTGTLDPFATGLLLVGVGRGATKHMQKLVGQDKRYSAVIVIGSTTETLDTESEAIHDKEMPDISNADIVAASKKLSGKIQQIPPMHSAIKKDGVPLYKLAREGKNIKIEPRDATVFEFDINKIERKENEFKVFADIHCSSGTYIRSIARDLGVLLGTVGYLESLRRIKISKNDVKNATELTKVTKNNWQTLLLQLKDIVVDEKKSA
ncbi:tRNA pseudouridine(55) synthase TruB, partial [Patescibacteria group bacterium]|nr:tRNA pseudouridine(55) synthase TruB [Patescibacteria group bacterium]